MPRAKKTAEPKKTTVTLFDAKPLETPVALGTIGGEDYEIVIEAPEGLPLPFESIKSTKNVPGGILWVANAFEGNPSFLDNKTDKRTLCLSAIVELDKGNKGFFNNAYFMNCDHATPALKQFEFFKEQFMKIWRQPEAPTEEMLITQFGGQMRLYVRAIAYRLFSYYHMGYKVMFRKVEKKVAPPVEKENSAVN